MALLPKNFWPKALYIHVPFCASRCPYCDFFVRVPQSRGQAAGGCEDSDEFMPFVRRCVEQLDSYLAQRPDLLLHLESIFLGGGTPSLLGAGPLRYLLEALLLRCAEGCAERSALLELTMESNPELIHPESLALWRSLGITRLSVGLQCQSDALLKLLGRRSSVAMHHEVARCIRDYFQDVDGQSGQSGQDTSEQLRRGECSFDFIYGIPGQSSGDIEQSLAFIGRYRPEHVSYYELGIEEGTLFALWRERGRLPSVPPEESEAQFYQILEGLEQLGYSRYEVSNFALPKLGLAGCDAGPALYRSYHNSCYWQWQPYLGLGPSAVGAALLAPQAGALAAAQVWRQQGAKTWQAFMSQPDFGVQFSTLGPKQSLWEYLLMALRLRVGIDAKRFCLLFYGLPSEGFGAAELRGKVEAMLEQNFPKTMARYASFFRWHEEGGHLFLQLDERGFDLQGALLRFALGEV